MDVGDLSAVEPDLQMIAFGADGVEVADLDVGDVAVRGHRAGHADCDAMGVSTEDPPTLYRAVGCGLCNQLGYRGRTGIYKLVAIDDAIRAMIHDGLGEYELERKAREDSPGIRQDGWDKVLKGITSIEEVLRVTRGD